MDKSQIDFLCEIKNSISALQNQLDEISAKVAAMEAGLVSEYTASPEPVAMADGGDLPDSFAEPVSEPEAMPVFEPEAEPVFEPAAEPEAMPAAEPEVVAELPIDIAIEVPSFEEEFHVHKPENINEAVRHHLGKSVNDAMKSRCAWKTDMPLPPVKNIISAISLNDRVLFINTLFREDPVLFQNTLAVLNSFSTFQEAEMYMANTFPEWKFDSDVVYRFIMAVRRKLR